MAAAMRVREHLHRLFGDAGRVRRVIDAVAELHHRRPTRAGGQIDPQLHRAHAEVEQMRADDRRARRAVDRHVARAERDEERRILNLDGACFVARGTHAPARALAQQRRRAIEIDAVADVEQTVVRDAPVDAKLLAAGLLGSRVRSTCDVRRASTSEVTRTSTRPLLRGQPAAAAAPLLPLRVCHT